jgi:hypothetical protein
MTFNSTMLVPSFVKINILVQKLGVETYTQKNMMT